MSNRVRRTFKITIKFTCRCGRVYHKQPGSRFTCSTCGLKVQL